MREQEAGRRALSPKFLSPNITPSTNGGCRVATRIASWLEQVGCKQNAAAKLTAVQRLQSSRAKLNLAKPSKHPMRLLDVHSCDVLIMYLND
uniref:Uncharacterized protein n=1 Tax=Ascaris lumbricoides TaxID=6252 RepID=A0A0M3HP00_ASCLU